MNALSALKSIRINRLFFLLFFPLLLVSGWTVLAAEPFPVNRNTLLLWHFNEGTGTNIVDASQYGRNGRFSPSLAADGASAWIDGESGFSNAVHYGAAAVDTFRKVQWNGATIKFSDYDAFSVQLRIKPTHFTVQDRFWALGVSLGFTCMLQVDPNLTGMQSTISNLNIYWYSGGHRNQAIALSEPLVAGVWQELTLVHRDESVTNAWNSTWQIWRDGRLIGSAASPYKVGWGADQIYVGSTETCAWNHHYEGDFDEFRIQTEAVYGVPDPDLRPFEADAKTLLLWHFDEGIGTNVTDASGNGRDGRFTPDLASDGPNAWLAAPPGFTNAIYMPGVSSVSNRCIEWVGSNLKLADLDAFSVQLRIKPKHFTAEDSFWAIGTGNGTCCSLKMDTSLTAPQSTLANVSVYLWSDAAHRHIPINLTEPLVAGVWQELTLVYRSADAINRFNSAWQIWKDGHLIGSSDATYQVGNLSEKVYVAGGESIVWHRHYEGALDEFRIQGEAVYAVIPPSGTVIFLK